MKPTEIYRHDEFYRDRVTRALKRKYFVVLAPLPGGSLVARLLTSRANGRPEEPKCYHGHPYSSYYLGVVGGSLTARSWVDLRYLDDIDPVIARPLIARGVIAQVGFVPRQAFLDLLDCVARAEDTSRLQERAIRDHLAVCRL